MTGNTEKTSKVAPTLLILIMLIQILSPFQIPNNLQSEQEISDSTLGRTAYPDINITAIIWIGPSYYCILCVIDVLAPVEQEVMIKFRNDGLLKADSTHFRFDVNSVEIANHTFFNVMPGEEQNYIFTWTPTLGNGQTFQAYAAITPVGADPDMSNNQKIKGFNSYFDQNDGDIYSDTLPPGGTRLPGEPSSVSVGVRNAGNTESEVTTLISLTPSGGGPPTEFFSQPINLSAGSVAEPAQVTLSSVMIDGTNLSGSYMMAGNVYFNSTLAPQAVVSIVPRIVTFSPYRATIVSPSDRAVEPGNSATLTFIVQNIGESADRFNISVHSVQGWFDSSSPSAPASQTPIISPGSSAVILVPVSVPLNTNRSESDLITVEIESEGAVPSYNVSGSSAVMAGDILQGTLNTSAWNVQIIPGQTESIQYTLNNTGTSPSFFELDTGFAQVAPGWSATIEPETTPYMTVGASIVVTVTVSPPALSLPFDPTTKLAEGNSLTLWTTVQPTLQDQTAGAPNVQETILEVQPAVMIEFITDETDLIVDISELNSGAIGKHIYFDMELRHNLMSNLSSLVDIELRTAPSAFDPSRSGVGSQEILRWNSSVTPNNATMNPGDTQALLASALGPFESPLAGIISIDVIANLTLSGALSGIQAPETTLTWSISIPELTEVEIGIPEPTIVVPGISGTASVNINNTGNHKTNLSYTVEGPAGWTVSTSPTEVTGLGSTFDTYPSIGTDNTTVSVTAIAPALWRADDVPDITLTVLDENGENVTQENIPFLVQELIEAVLLPDEAAAYLPVNETEIILLKVTNSGNSHQEFSMMVEDTLADINLRVLSNSTMSLDPGEDAFVDIEVESGQFARADENHSSVATLYHNGVGIAQTSIFVEVLPNHDIVFEHHPDYSVTPGKEAPIAFNITNNGNLDENINFSAILPEGWSAEISPENMTISAGTQEVKTVNVVVNVPPMSSGSGPEADSTHEMLFTATNATDNVIAGTTVVNFTTVPIFDIEAENFPDLIEMLPGEQRTFEVEISNAGNQNVSLDIDCTAGPPFDRWLVSNCDQSNYSLDIGETRRINFTVENSALVPYNGDEADLTLTFSPQDNQSGDRTISSELEVKRMWTEEEYMVTGDGDSGGYPIDVNWMHVQSIGQTADVRPIDYELKLINSTRLINTSLYNGNLNWGFELITSNGAQTFNPNSIPTNFSLGAAQPLQLNNLQFRLDLPPSAITPPGDGWVLEFELIHAEEGNATSTTVFLNVTVDNWADPSIVSILINDESFFEESNSGTIIATIENNGNAPTVSNLTAELTCDPGITILSPPVKSNINLTAHQSNYPLEWSIKSDALNWWQSSQNVDCKVTLSSNGEMIGDLESNNVLESPIELNSWSLPLYILVPLISALFILSSRLLRKAKEDERSLMLSAYSGSILLGCATQFGLGSGPNLALAATSLIWTALITLHSAGFEFPAVLSDRQNNLRGSESIIEDHDAEIDRIINQLRVKISFAPIGFILIALLMPSDIAWTLENIGSSALYLFMSALIVELTIRRTLATWLSIFDQLTVVEIESQDLLQLLGTPSTDLRRITIGQRWGQSHDVNVEVEGNV